MAHVNYDEMADHYDDRYQSGGPASILNRLEWLVQTTRAQIILEVGCGTGYWLTHIQGSKFRFGLDISARMLDIAKKRDRSLILIQGTAIRLPFSQKVFDLVFCVHALHHFSDPQFFIHEARRIIQKPGGLAIIGMDPQMEKDKWYIYDYFPGTYETDLLRYPSGNAIMSWMKEADFVRCERRLAAFIQHDFIGHEVLNDPILQKNGTSQLSLLSDEAFFQGMARIKGAIEQAERLGKEMFFPTHISIPVVFGFLQP